MTHAFLQMVSLYRDPEGEYVFNTAGNTLNTNEMNLNLVSGEVTTQMREKIVELESLLEKSQVSYGMMCIDAWRVFEAVIFLYAEWPYIDLFNLSS